MTFCAREKNLICFELSERDLSSLEQLMAKHSLRVFSIECEGPNSTSYKFDSIEELKKFSNPRDRAISNLRISGITAAPSRYFVVEFGGCESWNFRLLCEGEEDMVEDVRRRVLSITKDCRAWYAWLYKIKLFHFWILIFGCLTFFYSYRLIECALGSGRLTPRFWLNLILSSGEFAILAGTALALIALTLRSKILPRSNFLIGTGKDRFENSKITAPLILSGLVSVSTIWWVVGNLPVLYLAFLKFVTQLASI